MYYSFPFPAPPPYLSITLLPVFNPIRDLASPLRLFVISSLSLSSFFFFNSLSLPSPFHIPPSIHLNLIADGCCRWTALFPPRFLHSPIPADFHPAFLFGLYRHPPDRPLPRPRRRAHTFTLTGSRARPTSPLLPGLARPLRLPVATTTTSPG